MSGSPASRAARPGENDSILVSPLNPLVPTGYRNIQPFQKGKGWHSNGRTPRHRVASTQASDGAEEKERGVVFPLLPGHEHVRPGAQGPDVSAVEGAACGVDQPDDRLEKDEAANGPALTSPRAQAPPTNGAPRRPSRTEIRSNSSTGASFRGRALSGSGSRPTSPATVASDERLNTRREEADAAAPAGPDPALMQQLWQEYAARSHAANRQVDTAVYHEKMHRRYGEQRALRERVAHLEQALETMERERDEAQTQAQSATKQLALDRSTSELSDSTAASPSMKTARSSVVKAPQAGEPVNAEEKSYRERSFALERALSQAKVSLLAVQGELRQQTSRAAERTQALEAQLVLERNTSLELARQLREISAGFTRASAELVETRVTLEREQQRSQEVIEQAREQNAQLLSDTRRAQLETRMKLAVRSLGREALRQKMETLVSRTMRAEQNLRVAQLETERVCRERDATREQLEQVLSSHAIKYHSLGAAGGVPGILNRSTPLTNGARMISDQLLLLQVLYEETEEPEDPDGGFSVHFVAYEPRSAQDDFLTFHLRDVQRLVPNHESFLARHSVRRRERLEALADLLLNHIHAGYKNGHLVLAETSGAEAATQLPREQLAAQQEQHRTQQMAVYRGTRYLSVISGDDNDSVLADLSVTEAFAAATSQVWWLEVRAVMLGSEGGWDSESLTTKVDLRQLVTFCSTFASYRPSQSSGGSSNDDPELFAVHEALLEPLFDSLRVVVSEAGGTARLEIMGAEDDSRPSTGVESQTRRRRLSMEDQMHLEDELEEKKTAMAIRTPAVASTLTHQSVVNVGDVFYCVRLQELWDGELLLDLTMDDPETQHHFHRVLHEPQLAKLVERLILDGALDDDDDEERKTAALQVKFGLASVLHRPLCKLVCSHVQPFTSQTSTKTAPEAGQISLRGLFDDEDSGESLRSEGEAQAYEMRAMVLDAPACASLGWTYDREVRVITASRSVLPDEKAVHRVLQDILTVEDTQVRRQRTGVRLQGAAGFSLVQTIAANVSSFGDVALFDVLSLTTNLDGPSYLPLVLVVKDPARDDSPLQLVFEALGIEEDSSEFTREALARSRTGSRAHEPFGQEAPP
ncbi:hypothetical protein PHYPSEUDO_002917 [Phytophthora pseudosyringae]|uniref:Uncharacterized protein n=1 Tax=Phytophthora pseudosyringae TaxID=221518 RepID=A0A8T1VW08_9STRA|nr:hypothetical protein PHYPSEUDO_002917 [Phytophthora pseudosyringae]